MLIPEVPVQADIMDDFYIIAQESNLSCRDSISDTTSSETQVKSLTKFLRNITGSANTGGLSTSYNSGGNAVSTAASASNQVIDTFFRILHDNIFCCLGFLNLHFIYY